MRRIIFILGCIFCFILIAASSTISGKSPAAATGVSQRWLLSVKPGFSPSDVIALGGTCVWYWKEAGIAAVDSANPDFAIMAKGPKIDFAVADVAARLPKRLSIPKTAGSAPTFDAYASNYQWYWQAIGAVRPGLSNEPVWQLGDYTGSGIKVGIIDMGAPAAWSEWDEYFLPTPDTTFSLHPEFNEYDPAHPENGGVVLLKDSGGNVLNFDEHGHGTAVGSTLIAQHRGDGAMRGLAPRATLYFHKIDPNYWMSSALEGWYKAAEFGCQILNNSWYDVELPVMKYENLHILLPKIWRRAANELHRRGVLIVAAASNDGIDANKDSDTYYPYFYGLWSDSQAGFSAFKFIPQDMPNVVIAGGTGPADYNPFAPDLNIYNPWPGTKAAGQKGTAFNLDRHVNYFIPPDAGGPWVAGSTYGSFLTVVAPMGVNVKDWYSPDFLFQMIYIAVPYEWLPGEGRHDYWGGTSFSSPITCGVAALAAEAYFRIHGIMPSPATLATILKASADDMVGPATDALWVWNEKTLQFEFITNVSADKPGKDMRYGYGRVNVKKAIELAMK